MNWKATLSWEDAKKKAYILNQIRHFFFEKDVFEVETPILSRSTVTDVHLDVFTTEFSYFNNSSPSVSDALYLQTSPEFCMKRLLASGYQSIYQISKAFRHECKGRFHNPEFTILEWYRLGFNQADLIKEVSELLINVLDCQKPVVSTYQNIFIENINIDPLSTNISDLKRVIKTNNKMSDWINKENDLDVLLQFILSELIEPNIGQSSPQFIYNFPISQAALAQESKSDSRVAERFECYYKGIELVNGFCELTDPAEQVFRFKKDNLSRRALGLPERDIDLRFIDALKSGIPMCSGVALGVDRLLMIALNKHSIDEVMSFTIDRA